MSLTRKRANLFIKHLMIPRDSHSKGPICIMLYSPSSQTFSCMLAPKLSTITSTGYTSLLLISDGRSLLRSIKHDSCLISFSWMIARLTDNRYPLYVSIGIMHSKIMNCVNKNARKILINNYNR